MINVMWQKVNTFFFVFKQSLFPRSTYYSKIPKARFIFSLKYFVGLTIILNLILISVMLVRYHPTRVSRFLNSVITGLNRYPSELTVNIAKGRLFSSLNRPYFLWGELDRQKKLLLVIDETAAPEKINMYNSILLLTSQEVVLKTGDITDTSFSVLPLSYFSRQSVNRKIIDQTIRTMTVFTNLVFFGYLILISLLVILLPLSSFVITLFYLVVISLIIYYIFKIYFKKKIHYRKTLQVALHAVTFPLILDYFLIIFRPTIPANIEISPRLPTPMVFLILLAVFVFAAVYQAYENGKHHVVHHIHPAKAHHK